MPVNEAMISTRNGQTQSEMQSDVTVLLLSFIAALVVVTLLFASNEFAEAMLLLGSV